MIRSTAIVIKFPERLKAARELRDWTQTQLGATMDVGKAAVANWESGKNMPPGEDLIKLAGVLGLTVAELLGEVDLVLAKFSPKPSQAPMLSLIVTPDEMRRFLELKKGEDTSRAASQIVTKIAKSQ